MEQWSLAGSAIVNRIIPLLQHSVTPPLRLHSITDYLRKAGNISPLPQSNSSGGRECPLNNRVGGKAAEKGPLCRHILFFQPNKLDQASRGGRNGVLLIPKWCLDQSSSKIKCKTKPGAGAVAPNQPGI
jgi:hypothetical protein